MLLDGKKLNNIGIYFDKLAKKNRNSIAIKFSKKEEYTFHFLNELSKKFLVYFNSIGLKEGSLIALESRKNIFIFAIIIAALKKGITYSFFDSSESKKRINLILKKLKPNKIFVFENKKKFNKSTIISEILLKKILNLNTKKKIILKNRSYRAYVMFTSGSTGQPKGVQISHSNLIFFINWIKKRFGIRKTNVVTNLNSLHFDNSVFDIYGSIFNGATLVPIKKSEILNCKKLLVKLKKLKCDIWFSVPSLLNLILKIEKPSIFKNNFFKKFIFGGERFPVKSVRNIFRYLRNSEIYNVSGPTECTCICSAHLVKESELFKSEDIFVGKINDYFNYKIMNNNKIAKQGELYLEGPAVSCGYINDNKITLEKFYKVGKHKGYRTGDIVFENKNKNLNIIGRKDNQIKFLGHRIELEEIEKNINEVFKLRDCLVIFTKKKEFPHEKLILLTDDKKLNTEKLVLNLIKCLPKFMIPEDVQYIQNFKLNQNGKIDRQFYSKKIII